MANLEYMKGCTLCSDGVVTRMKELIAEGKAEAKAAAEISNEITAELGEELYSFSAIKSRYRRIIGLDTTDHKDPEYKTVKERMAEEVAKSRKQETPAKEPKGSVSSKSLAPTDGEKLVGPQWEWLTDNCKIDTYSDACWYIGGDQDIRPEANIFLLDKAFETFSEPETDDEIEVFRQICICKKIIEKHIKKNF